MSDTPMTKIAVLENNIKQIEKVFDRLDLAITKIGDLCDGINKVLAVHNEKLDHQDRVNEDIYRALEVHRQETKESNAELHSRITTTTRELENKIVQSEMKVLAAVADLKKAVEKEEERTAERIAQLEKSKYIMIGIGTAVGFIISKILPLVMNMF
jgi:enamine deaminase RidA (YjgF/YER057c/UK114 family)